MNFRPSLIYSCRCLDAESLMPAGRPILCEYNRNKADIYVSGCCKDSDMCNERMNLTLAPPKHRTTTKSQRPGKDWSCLLLVPTTVWLHTFTLLSPGTIKSWKSRECAQERVGSGLYLPFYGLFLFLWN